MEQLLKIKTKYFPNKSFTTLLDELEEYYETDISDWSDEKLAKSIAYYAENKTKTRKKIYTLPFEPMKAKYIQLSLENSYIFVVPVTEISKLLIDKESVMQMFNNDDYQKHFEYSHELHTAASIVMKFKADKVYTFYKGNTTGEKKKLTEFLAKHKVTGIRCVYNETQYSYEINAEWVSNGKNKYQKVTKEYEGIVLYIGEYAKA